MGDDWYPLQDSNLGCRCVGPLPWATWRSGHLDWCWLEGSNLPPLVYETSALPDELSQRDAGAFLRQGRQNAIRISLGRRRIIMRQKIGQRIATPFLGEKQLCPSREMHARAINGVASKSGRSRCQRADGADRAAVMRRRYRSGQSGRACSRGASAQRWLAMR